MVVPYALVSAREQAGELTSLPYSPPPNPTQDKTYAPSAKVPLIYDVGLALFLKRILRSPNHPIHSQLISTLLGQIRLERDGEVINRSAMHAATNIFQTLSEKDGGGR